MSEDDTVRETGEFIEQLNFSGELKSDHILNLIPEIEGKFPRDKQKMLAVIDRYLSLPEEGRLLYRLGRRGGALQSLDDLNDPRTRSRLERARRDLAAEKAGDLERIITELGDQYI